MWPEATAAPWPLQNAKGSNSQRSAWYSQPQLGKINTPGNGAEESSEEGSETEQHKAEADDGDGLGDAAAAAGPAPARERRKGARKRGPKRVIGRAAVLLAAAVCVECRAPVAAEFLGPRTARNEGGCGEGAAFRVTSDPTTRCLWCLGPGSALGCS